MSLTDKIFREAVAALKGGNISNAERSFLKVLRSEPSHIGALNLLTVILIKRRQFAEAEKYIERAVKLNPASDVSHYNYGLICKNLGKRDKALEQFSKALQINDTVPETWNNRGTVFNDLKRYNEAIADFDRALSINPNYADALYNKARSLNELQRDDDALASYKKALALNPDLVSAWIGLSDTLCRLKQYDDALAACDKAIALKPDLAEGWLGRGTALSGLARNDEALVAHDRALALKPRLAEAWHGRGGLFATIRRYQEAFANYDNAIALNANLDKSWVGRGNMLWRLNRFDEALSAYDSAETIRPNTIEVWHGRACVFTDLKQYDKSFAALDRALEIKPDLAEAWCSRAHVFALLRRNDEALAANAEAIKLNNDLVDAHFNKGLMHLLMGQYEQGWLEYEWRNKLQLSVGTRKFVQPLWLGEESLRGKTILLHSEQGLGDTLQFCRYVPLVAEMGANVVLEIQKPLLGLLKSLPGVTELIETGHALPDFDYQTPLMSLPLAFKTNLANVPTNIPYLAAEQQSVLQWSNRLGATSKKRIGLVWSGGFRPDRPELWTTNERRNLPLHKLAPLGHIDCEFYSLQKGEPAETELADILKRGWDGPDIIDLTSSMHGFSDTAAFIANLDLVISVDTSTAHLVAAMDRPLWVLNRFDIDWRWANNSAWYPKASLYIQPSPGDWDSVIHQVASDLKNFAEAARET